MMNRLAHLISSDDMTYADWKREVGEPFYTYQGDSGQSFDLGLYSVGLDRVQELVRDTQAGFTGEATVSNQWGEKDVILDEDQQRFFAFMSILDGVASLGLMDAGLYRLFEKIKREQLKSGGSTPGQAQQRPRPRPMPRPRPLPRPASNLQR